MNFHHKLVIVSAVILVAMAGYGSSFMPTENELAQQTTAQKFRTAEYIERLLQDKGAGQEYIQIDDMLFRADALRDKSGFSGNLWPEGKVYYEFDANVIFADRQAWLKGAGLWSNVSSVSFIERTTEPNYIHVESALYDSSYVGMAGGPQLMTIFSWVAPFVIAHEVGHALGLAHEHSRSDRDDYVTILTDNILPDYLFNFDIQPTTNHGIYDFDSVMHYRKNAFSKEPLNRAIITIEPKSAYSQWLDLIGQNDHLSVLDAQGMAQRYGGLGTLQPPATIIARTGWLKGEIIVNWDAVPGARGYRIYYEEADDGPPYTPTQDGTPVSGSDLGIFTDTTIREVTIRGLPPGQWYYVTLKAITKVLESDYAVPVVVRSLPLPNPDDNYEPNNDFEHAYDVSDNIQDYLDNLNGRGKQRDDDWYKIFLRQDQLRVQIECRFNEFNHSQVGIGLYTEGGTQLGYSSTTTVEQFLDVVVPDPGTYGIKVDGDNTGVIYDFKWNAFPAPGEGEGEPMVEGEGEVIEGEQTEGEGELPGEGEDEPECCGGACDCNKTILTPDGFKRQMGDWLIVGATLIVLATLGTNIRSKRP